MPDLPADIDVIHAPPRVEDYLELRRAAGMSVFSPQAAKTGLAHGLHSVTLLRDGRTIGMGRIVGDGGCFVQVVDIVVDEPHRGQGLGKIIMDDLMTYVRDHLPQSVFVSLLADVPADALYAQFGFEETAPETLGMSLVREDGT